MFNIYKKAALALALGSASLSAHAIEAHISVWTDIDPTLALLKPNGDALDDVVKLAYQAGSGLTPWSDQVRIYSNDILKDVEVRLSQAAVLQPTSAAGSAVDVPLTVSLKGVDLKTDVYTFTAAELFNGSPIQGGSVEMPLQIRQTVRAPITAAGRYEGMVSLVLAQGTGTP